MAGGPRHSSVGAVLLSRPEASGQAPAQGRQLEGLRLLLTKRGPIGAITNTYLRRTGKTNRQTDNVAIDKLRGPAHQVLVIGPGDTQMAGASVDNAAAAAVLSKRKRNTTSRPPSPSCFRARIAWTLDWYTACLLPNLNLLGQTRLSPLDLAKFLVAQRPQHTKTFQYSD